jgi:Flp pilus assembly protein TadG
VTRVKPLLWWRREVRRPRRAGRPWAASRLWGDDRGALTLSYIAVMPFVFLFIMVLIQASFWFLARDAALAAARQGADAARAMDAPRAAGPAAALAFARRAGQGYLQDPVASAAGSTGSTISITVSGHVPSFVPGLIVHVTETVQAPAEVFRS